MANVSNERSLFSQVFSSRFRLFTILILDKILKSLVDADNVPFLNDDANDVVVDVCKHQTKKKRIILSFATQIEF